MEKIKLCLIANKKYYNYNQGYITVDCDGQHLKSSFGNNITSSVFKILYGVNISDTQTGLRGIPSKYLGRFISINGDRYEYETNMLIDCILRKIKMVEIPITTIYLDNNADSHFRPIIDSILIFCKILNSFIKYSIISLLSFLLDIVVFKIIISNIEGANSIFIATVFARILSSIVNYILNKNVAFKSEKKISSTMIKYYILTIVQMIMSAITVTVVFKLTNFSETLVKIVVDSIIFIVNFIIQKKWIFNN